MHNTAGDGVAQASHDQNAAYRAVVSDLVGLAEQIQSCLRLIERMIAGETSPGSPESSADVVVLDDISPRYSKAVAAVQACDVNIAVALQCLLDSGARDPHAASPALSAIGA